MDSGAVSKVLHLRGLPMDVTEQEIVTALTPMGAIKNVLLLRGKGQAFVEMNDVAAAVNIVTYFPTVNVRGQTARTQYSSHQELKIDPSAAAGSSGASDDQPSPVLLVQIINMVYPITLEILVSIFSRHGQVVKIITFTKGGVFQALLQMSDVQTAVVCRNLLNGQHIYTGCCMLQISFSKMKDLVVKFNNDKSWDFSNPSLPSQLAGGAAAAHPMPSLSGMGGMASGMGGMGAQMGMPVGQCVVLVSNLVEGRVSCDVLFTLFGVVGDVLRVKIAFKNKSSALIQYREPAQAQLAVSHLNGVPLFGVNLHVQLSKHAAVSQPRSEAEAAFTKDYTNSPLHRFKNAGSKNRAHVYPASQYLHISNLPEGMRDDEVAQAIAPHASVVSFRRFPNDAKMAVVQVGSLAEAVNVLLNLHNTALGASAHIRISFAKGPAAS